VEFPEPVGGFGLEPGETPPGGREMREPAGKIMYKITLL
jgi:hypothetical protein